MKRRVLVLFATVALALGGCSGSASSNNAAEASSNATAAQANASAVEFRGVTLQLPSTWSQKEDVGKGLEDTRCWIYGGDDKTGTHGPVFAVSATYESFGNTNTQMPDPSETAQLAIKTVTDAGLKALDAKMLLELAAKGCMQNLGETIEVDQADFTLEENQGHAAWVYTRTSSAGTFMGYSVLFDDRMVAGYASFAGDELSAEQEAILKSLEAVEPSDSSLFVMASALEGKSQEDAMSKLLEVARLPDSADELAAGGSELGSVSSDTGGTKPDAGSTKGDTGGTKSDAGSTKGDTGGTKSDAGSTKGDTGGTKSDAGSTKDDRSMCVSSTGDFFVEIDDGGVMSFSKDGSFTLYNDNSITTVKGDGTLEWTDGKGRVVRDENGDCVPDYVSLDSGETWLSAK